MTPPDTTAMSPDEYEDLLAQQDWNSLAKRLTEFVYRKINRTSWEDAEDIAQSAIQQMYDARYQRWNPKKQPNIFWFLGHVAYGLIANRAQKKKRSVEISTTRRTSRSSPPRRFDATDDVMARRERAKLIVAELERRSRPTGGAGSCSPRSRRRSTTRPRRPRAPGCTLQAVYNARHKLRALATEIAHTFDQGSEPRTLQ